MPRTQSGTQWVLNLYVLNEGVRAVEEGQGIFPRILKDTSCVFLLCSW